MTIGNSLKVPIKLEITRAISKIFKEFRSSLYIIKTHKSNELNIALNTNIKTRINATIFKIVQFTGDC